MLTRLHIKQTDPPRPPTETLPTMYDLPSEDPNETGLPDEYHYLQPQLLRNIPASHVNGYAGMTKPVSGFRLMLKLPRKPELSCWKSDVNVSACGNNSVLAALIPTNCWDNPTAITLLVSGPPFKPTGRNSVINS